MLEKVISGGQTGVDQAALDAAGRAGVPCGGWCPKDRWSEAGPIDARYPLVETPSADPALRTEWNVRDSDATLIIARGRLTGGTALTRRLADARRKPCLVVDPRDESAPQAIRQWLTEHEIRILNVAGPRESDHPGIHAQALELLRLVLGG
jgi:hypothetical protein